MVAVFVFMVAYFFAMGAVTALADAVLRRRRRRPGAGRRSDLRRQPPPWSAAEERLLMPEIEAWLSQQPR